MNDYQVLQGVKEALGMAGNSFHDAALLRYIAEVKEYLMDGGVPPEIINAETSIGIIARGVSDLWNYGSGNAELSPYFRERAIQLASRGVDYV